MKGAAPISGIYRMAEVRTEDENLEAWGRLERLRRLAWVKSGVVSVTLDELPEDLATRMRKWADERYGRR